MNNIRDTIQKILMVIRNKYIGEVENMNKQEDRNNRIRELRMKLNRRIMCKELGDIIDKLEDKSFISVEDTIEISKKVYEKIDITIEQQEIQKDINDNLIKVTVLKDKYSTILNEYGILFHKEDRECGAIKVKVEDFFKNIGYIVKFTGFEDGYRDLIFVGQDLEYGICIEEYEYYNKLISWN